MTVSSLDRVPVEKLRGGMLGSAGSGRLDRGDEKSFLVKNISRGGILVFSADSVNFRLLF